MTEAEWLACKDPRRMMDYLQENRKGSLRKLRLFGIACCRLLTHLFTDAVVRKALDASERYADGQIRDSTIMGWYRKMRASRDSLPKGGGHDEKWLAYHAVAQASLSNAYSGHFDAHRTVAEALAQEAGSPPSNTPTGGLALARRAASLTPLLREVVGNPFRPVVLDSAWLTPNVLALARTIYDEHAFDRLPILADALMDAGCDDADILSHCRGPGPHVRDCWVIDLILGKS